MDAREQYYQKGRVVGDKYNFPLLPLITDFSFYDFCTSASTPDHGAFLIITNRQYIVGYNAGFGEGSHLCAFARAMKDLKGGGTIMGFKESVRLCTEAEQKFVTARIVYEKYDDILGHLQQTVGYIHFDFTHKTITRLQYEEFLKFYEKYNEDIKYICKKFNFQVKMAVHNEKGVLEIRQSDSLDQVLEYMKNQCIEVDEHLDEDEIIFQPERKKIL